MERRETVLARRSVWPVDSGQQAATSLPASQQASGQQQPTSQQPASQLTSE
jgi:hypothetical protein